MVSCYLQGGLGNYMFQIAAADVLAKKNNTTSIFFVDMAVKVHKSIYDYADNIFRNVKLVKGNPNISNVYHESKFTHSVIPYMPNLMMVGYFQTEKYLKGYEEYIRSVFSPRKEDVDYIESKYGDLLDKKTCSIHVRRGDYLNLKDHHPPCGVGYYENAFDFMDDDTTYLVFSDDIGWCKETFTGEQFVFIEDELDYIDLYLMSMCDNNIIANSSFSWWAAWLNKNNDKIVVAPNKWFGKSKAGVDTSDIIPKKWVKI